MRICGKGIRSGLKKEDMAGSGTVVEDTEQVEVGLWDDIVRRLRSNTVKASDVEVAGSRKSKEQGKPAVINVQCDSGMVALACRQ